MAIQATFQNVVTNVKTTNNGKVDPKKITSANLQTAQNSTSKNETNLQNALGKLDFQVRAFGQTISDDQLKFVASKDTILSTNDLDRLPKALGWDKANVQNLNTIIVGGNGGKVDKNKIASANIQAGRNFITDGSLREILGKLDFQARAFDKTYSQSDLTKLAGKDGIISTNNANDVARILNWA